MKLPVVLITVTAMLLILHGLAAVAQAQQRALFLTKNPLVYAGMDYRLNYLNSSSSNSSTSSDSQQHTLSPIGFLSFDYAIYDPDILNGRCAVELKYDKGYFSNSPGTSGSNSGLDFLYDITGIIIERKPVSFNFFARSEQTRVQRDYASPYDQNTDSYGVGTSLRNPLFPTLLSYSWTRIETTGLYPNYVQYNSQFLLKSTNTYRNLSQTFLDLSYNNIRGTPQGGSYLGGSNYTFLNISLRNQLTWNSGSNRREVDSLLRYMDQTGSFTDRYLEWQESLFWDLGKALRWGGEFAVRNRDSSAQSQFSAVVTVPVTQAQTTTSAQAWIQHRLYESLTTRLSVQGIDDQYRLGYERSVSGAVALAYQKKLPHASELQLQVNEFYQVTDRNLGTPLKSVVNAPMTLFAATSLNLIRNVDVVGETVTVRTQDLARVYRRGVDYDLDQRDNLTFISINLPGSQIVPGETVAITYDYLVDPVVTFSTNIVSLGGNLSLLDNRYRLYTSYENTSQDLLSGTADLFTLTSTSMFRAGAETVRKANTLGLEYLMYTSTYNSRDAIEAYWRFSPELTGSSLSLQLRERYSWYQSKGYALTTQYNENVLMAQVVYNRQLFQTGLLRLTGSYLMSRLSPTKRDDIQLRATYTMMFGKFLLQGDVQGVIRDVSTTSQNTVYLTIQMRRYF